jgi:uncharacterized protein (TIGR03435 family)
MRLAVFLVSAGAVLAQTQDRRPTFEVASVKSDNSGSPGSSTRGSKGQIVFTNITLKRLVERAYDVKPFQVTGPSWLESVRFDIVAKYPPDTKNQDRALMLRSLLEDRFKLAVHVQQQEVAGYSLVVAKGGFKLKPDAGETSGDSSNDRGRVRNLIVKHTSMAQVADLMARNLGEAVVDKTGVGGFYSFELRWASEDQKADNAELDTLPSLFTALQETLGLRLKPEKVPVDIVIVDHMERAPIEN